MTRPRTALLALLLASLLLPAAASAAPSGWRLWLGDQQIGEAPQPQRALRDDDLPPLLPSRKELAVVTTDELAMASTQLWRLLDFRAAEGFEVHLFTEADWDHPVAQGPDGVPFRIRAFLADRYADDPGAYLLLIGDPDPEHGDLPMVQSHPMESLYHWYEDWLAELFEEIPTDWFYADLDSTWDCDDDGRLAEYPDDRDCTDWTPELIVGRLPVYDGDVEAMDHLIARLLARDLESDTAYRLNPLLPGALFGVQGTSAPGGGDYETNDDGACILDALHQQLPPAFQQGATRLYEETGALPSSYEHEGSLDRDQVVQSWAEGRGMVIWAGHGSSQGVYRTCWADDYDGDGLASDAELEFPAFMESDDTAALAGAPGAFTWHISCSNGTPEDEDNIGAALLYGGAAATATASRVAFGVTVPWGEVFEPRPDLATSSTAGYFYALGLAEGQTVGETMAWTKYGLPGDGWVYPDYDYTGAAWTTRFEYNLYGDPTRSLGLCEANSDCDDGSACNGVETCEAGVCSRTGVEVDCSHLDDACSIGRCAADSGACVAQPRLDGSPCDDGAWCTEGDSCSAGVCSGEERWCGERDGYDVYCDEPLQTCVFEELADDDDDGDAACSGCDQLERAPARAPLALLLVLLTTVLRRRARREEIR
jgi:hypothetical protein